MGQEYDRHFEDFRKANKIEQGGIIRLSGKFLLDHGDEVVNLINNEGKMAEERNPLHRVSKIEKKDGSIVAEVTDHNLTLHIGKQIYHAFKGKHDYKFLKGEKFVEVDWRRDD